MDVRYMNMQLLNEMDNEATYLAARMRSGIIPEKNNLVTRHYNPVTTTERTPYQYERSCLSAEPWAGSLSGCDL